MQDNLHITPGEVVVVQLAERYLTTLEVRGSNLPSHRKYYDAHIYC